VHPTTTLGEELRRRRGDRSLQEVSSQAKISTAYLHKLENGRVGNPSPRVLERLAGVLEIPYWTLMDLAGYVPAGQAGRPRRAGRKETTVSHRSGTESPTNAEIVRLLREITAQLERLEDNQDGLARLLEKAESPQ
jgi:transcriptional regulator with XRE-family HTH domain